MVNLRKKLLWKKEIEIFKDKQLNMISAFIISEQEPYIQHNVNITSQDEIKGCGYQYLN